jgi:D-hydroxyproline dehydrogenase subunit beta
MVTSWPSHLDLYLQVWRLASPSKRTFASARLAALLEEDEGARVIWRACVHAIGAGVVEADRTSVRAPLVLVSPGPGYVTLPPDVRPHRPGLTQCRLQMLRVGAPDGRRYQPALLTGLTLLRYPALESQPGSARLRARLERERPEAMSAGIHLIVTQLADGDLILGDTHDYADTVTPFREERSTSSSLPRPSGCWASTGWRSASVGRACTRALPETRS